MKVKGNITILVNTDYTRIQIMDENSSSVIVEINLTSEQFVSALSRLAHVKCEIDWYNLEKVGKKQEHQDFTFEIPSNLSNSIHSAELTKLCIDRLNESGMSEWKPDSYFGSQSTFFSKGDQRFAKTTIRRWV